VHDDKPSHAAVTSIVRFSLPRLLLGPLVQLTSSVTMMAAAAKCVMPATDCLIGKTPFAPKAHIALRSRFASPKSPQRSSLGAGDDSSAQGGAELEVRPFPAGRVDVAARLRNTFNQPSKHWPAQVCRGHVVASSPKRMIFRDAVRDRQDARRRRSFRGGRFEWRNDPNQSNRSGAWAPRRTRIRSA
jgi:hypothetical protein